MPQGEQNAPKTQQEQEEADRLAGWDVDRHGPAPFEHGIAVPGLEVQDEYPEGIR